MRFTRKPIFSPIFSKVGLALFVAIMTLSSLGCWDAASSNLTPATPNLSNQEMKRPDSIFNTSNHNASKNVKVNSKLVEANTRFGFKLFSEILKQGNTENIFVSPSSIAIALSMTYNGASGETQQAMAKALELQGISLEELNQANANLKTVLEKADPKVQLTIANSLWAKQGVSFNPSFVQRNQNFYGASVQTLNFDDPAAPQTINSWVKDNTGGKIEQMIDRISPDQVMFLLNAIYFKGKWTNEFDKKQTEERPFSLINGTQKQHPLMKQKGKYRYYENEQFQAVSLPYGNERMSFYVFLPKQSSNLSTFYKNLTAENWQTWMQQFGQREGSVQIPRFQLSYDVNLKEALSALGMGIAFDESKANFSGLSNATTKIDQVKHKTFVEVNEEGTEAAAVTSVGIVATSAPIDEPFNMVVDRPFFCAIRDNKTGEILFMGSVVDPKAS